MGISSVLIPSLWGMPIGEFFDLEQLSKVCAETGRYTFFFSSWPLNMCVIQSYQPEADRNIGAHSIGGVASPPNAAVGLSSVSPDHFTYFLPGYLLKNDIVQ